MYAIYENNKYVGYSNIKEETDNPKIVYKEATDEQIKEFETTIKGIDLLRQKRAEECFSIINRGQLWYNTLTTEQVQELNTWYQAWLDVTETKIIPTKPSWLK